MLPPKLAPDTYKPKERLRSPAHRDWVRKHHCSIPGCQNMPIEVAHVRSAATAGIGVKSSDGFCLSLCRDHHAEQHRIGQQSFEAKYDFSMLATARLFFTRSPHKNKLDDPHGL